MKGETSRIRCLLSRNKHMQHIHIETKNDERTQRGPMKEAALPEQQKGGSLPDKKLPFESSVRVSWHVPLRCQRKED